MQSDDRLCKLRTVSGLWVTVFSSGVRAYCVTYNFTCVRGSFFSPLFCLFSEEPNNHTSDTLVTFRESLCDPLPRVTGAGACSSAAQYVGGALCAALFFLVRAAFLPLASAHEQRHAMLGTGSKVSGDSWRGKVGNTTDSHTACAIQSET